MFTASPTGDQCETREDVSLSRGADYLLEECRMVLPGIQALFGFQLVAVFNARFTELTACEQRIHLVAIGLVAAAVVLIMTPAAYHRQTSTRTITSTFIRLSTRLLLWSMIPLAGAISLDFYLIARMILSSRLGAVLATTPLSMGFLLWFLLPRVRSFKEETETLPRINL